MKINKSSKIQITNSKKGVKGKRKNWNNKRSEKLSRAKKCIPRVRNLSSCVVLEKWRDGHQKEALNLVSSKDSTQSLLLSWKSLWFLSNQSSDVIALTAFIKIKRAFYRSYLESTTDNLLPQPTTNSNAATLAHKGCPTKIQVYPK